MYEWAKSERGFHRRPLLYSKTIVKNPSLRRKLRKCQNQWKTSAKCGWWIDEESFVAGSWEVEKLPSLNAFAFQRGLIFSNFYYFSFISYYTFFLGLLCNNLYSFACYRCNHFVFRFVLSGFASFFFLDGLGVLLRITHYRWCRLSFAQKKKIKNI